MIEVTRRDDRTTMDEALAMLKAGDTMARLQGQCFVLYVVSDIENLAVYSVAVPEPQGSKDPTHYVWRATEYRYTEFSELLDVYRQAMTEAVDQVLDV